MNNPPSLLAIKLAQRVFKTPTNEQIADIDNVLVWHEREEWRRIHDENKRLPGFCENICVFGGRDRREYFELQLLPAEPDLPYQVQFKRYAVPGRYWIYGFNYQHEGSGRVVYGSEGTEVLAKSLKLIEADLNKPQVVGLFEQAFSAERIVCRYQQDTLALLGSLAPKSKACRVTRKLCEETMATRKARFETKKNLETILLQTP